MPPPCFGRRELLVRREAGDPLAEPDRRRLLHGVVHGDDPGMVHPLPGRGLDVVGLDRVADR
jgi:hypothetical protein